MIITIHCGTNSKQKTLNAETYESQPCSFRSCLILARWWRLES